MSYQETLTKRARTLRQPLTFDPAKARIETEGRQRGRTVLIELTPPDPKTAKVEFDAHIDEAVRLVHKYEAQGLVPRIVLFGVREPQNGMPTTELRLQSGRPAIEALRDRLGVAADSRIRNYGNHQPGTVPSREITAQMADLYDRDRDVRNVVVIGPPNETTRRLVEYENRQILAQGRTPLALLAGRTHPYGMEAVLHAPREALAPFTNDIDGELDAFRHHYAGDPDLGPLHDAFIRQHAQNGNRLLQRQAEGKGKVTLISIATQHNPKDTENVPCLEFQARMDEALDLARRLEAIGQPVRFFLAGAGHAPREDLPLATQGRTYLEARSIDPDAIITDEKLPRNRQATSGEDEVAAVCNYVDNHEDIGRLVTVTSHAYTLRKGMLHEIFGVPTEMVAADFDPAQVWQMPCVEALFTRAKADWLLDAGLIKLNVPRNSRAEVFQGDNTAVREAAARGVAADVGLAKDLG